MGGYNVCGCVDDTWGYVYVSTCKCITPLLTSVTLPSFNYRANTERDLRWDWFWVWDRDYAHTNTTSDQNLSIPAQLKL